jgi:hypothetical protein
MFIDFPETWTSIHASVETTKRFLELSHVDREIAAEVGAKIETRNECIATMTRTCEEGFLLIWRIVVGMLEG